MHAIEIADGDDRPDQPFEASPVKVWAFVAHDNEGMGRFRLGHDGILISVRLYGGRPINDTLTDLAAKPRLKAQVPAFNRFFNRTLLPLGRVEGGQSEPGRVPHSSMATVAAAQAALPSADGAGRMAVDTSMPILVVDDYNTMIRIIRNLLRQLGFKDIDDASDGSMALSKMHAKRYSLIISDWNMEPMTGYELLKEVRSDPGLASTPFIMVTAESKTENVIAAKQAGVNNYIVKPFNSDTLKSKIDAVFLTP
jgi:two-component system chemotaxis response regulator CheY